MNINKNNRSASNRTSKKWERSEEIYAPGGFKEYWETLDDIIHYQLMMMTQGIGIPEYLGSLLPKDKILKNMTGLIIGCEYGKYSKAHSFAWTFCFDHILVVDISEELIKKQMQLSDELGLNDIIEYKVMDLNINSIHGENVYDLIFSAGTIHHIERLEGLFSEINTALKKDGIFAMREYIGPNLLQFTDKQLEIANRILDVLPTDIKKMKNDSIKKIVQRNTIEDILDDDPSEAIRSQDIVNVAKDHLKILQYTPTGGTILHPLLHGITQNFEKGVLEKTLLKLIIIFEKTLMEENIIPSDFIFLVGAKKI